MDAYTVEKILALEAKIALNEMSAKREREKGRNILAAILTNHAKELREEIEHIRMGFPNKEPPPDEGGGLGAESRAVPFRH